MTTPFPVVPGQAAQRWHQRLRRELIWGIALKVVLLFSMVHAANVRLAGGLLFGRTRKSLRFPVE